MEIFRKQPDLNLERMNTVRIHLRLLYIPEITTADGQHLLTGYMRNQESSTRRISNLHWPIQPSPGKRAWKEWTKALSNLKNRQDKLKKPVGQWHTNLDSYWKYGYDPSTTHRIIKRTGTRQTLHSLVGGSYRKIYGCQGQQTRGIINLTPVPAATTESGI